MIKINFNAVCENLHFKHFDFNIEFHRKTSEFKCQKFKTIVCAKTNRDKNKETHSIKRDYLEKETSS